jgi:hypothetical protein
LANRRTDERLYYISRLFFSEYADDRKKAKAGEYQNTDSKVSIQKKGKCGKFRRFSGTLFPYF